MKHMVRITHGLTLWQPWATLLVRGYKQHETRSWYTSFRGALAICAAKKWNEELRDTCVHEPFWTPLSQGGDFDPDSLPRGYVVGVVTLTDCYRALGRESPHAVHDRDFGDFSAGRWAWRCDNPIELSTPIPITGKQGIFTLPETISVEVSTHIINR
jgi:activating signal cointegrator 1